MTFSIMIPDTVRENVESVATCRIDFKLLGIIPVAVSYILKNETTL